MPVVEVLEESAGPILALRVKSGRSGGDDPQQVAARAQDTIGRHGSLRLLVLMDRIGLLEAASLRSLLPLASGMSGDVQRVAVVGDQRWLDGAVRAAPGKGSTQVRVFPLSQAGDARAWLSEASLEA